MKIIALSICLLIGCYEAHADSIDAPYNCEDYESCMEKSKPQLCDYDPSGQYDCVNYKPMNVKIHLQNRAIAYKLDEISKKLDNQPGKTGVMTTNGVPFTEI